MSDWGSEYGAPLMGSSTRDAPPDGGAISEPVPPFAGSPTGIAGRSGSPTATPHGGPPGRSQSAVPRGEGHSSAATNASRAAPALSSHSNGQSSTGEGSGPSPKGRVGSS